MPPLRRVGTCAARSPSSCPRSFATIIYEYISEDRKYTRSIVERYSFRLSGSERSAKRRTCGTVHGWRIPCETGADTRWHPDVTTAAHNSVAINCRAVAFMPLRSRGNAVFPESSAPYGDTDTRRCRRFWWFGLLFTH